MNHMTSTSQHGFTLIELVLYVAIIGTLLTSISIFFGTSIDARIKNQGINEVNQQGIATMEYVSQTIRNATAITSPAIGASASSLVVTVPTGALSPTTFSLSGTALQVQENATITTLTSANVAISGLTFKNVSRSSTAKAVQVTFTVSRANASGRAQYDYQKTFTTTVVPR